MAKIKVHELAKELELQSKDILSFLQEKGIFPAYHMSKTCWISVLLDGTVSEETLSFLIDVSFELTNKSAKNSFGA